jgi:Uma2 family endonuclease
MTVATIERPVTFFYPKEIETTTKKTEFDTEEDDEFYYGYRYQSVYAENGEEELIMVPLTLDDFLDPQEGDRFVQGIVHYEDTSKLYSIFKQIHRDTPTTIVLSDVKIYWNIKGLKNPAPDIAVIPNVANLDRGNAIFDVTKYGTRPIFVLEVISPRYRSSDRNEKVPIYERARIKEYFIIDSWLKKKSGKISYEILGYRLQGRKYVKIEPNEHGRLYSETNNIWLGVSEQKDSFFILDAQTGESVLTADERAEQAEHQVEIERQAKEKLLAKLRELGIDPTTMLN